MIPSIQHLLPLTKNDPQSHKSVEQIVQLSPNALRAESLDNDWGVIVCVGNQGEERKKIDALAKGAGELLMRSM